MVVKGSHFENPGFAVTGSTAYDYVAIDNHSGNLLRVSDSDFLQDARHSAPRGS